MGFEPTILVFQCAKTFHVLDRAATVIADYRCRLQINARETRRNISTDPRSKD
jgi:hypothetical protein